MKLRRKLCSFGKIYSQISNSELLRFSIRVASVDIDSHIDCLSARFDNTVIMLMLRRLLVTRQVLTTHHILFSSRKSVRDD